MTEKQDALQLLRERLAVARQLPVTRLFFAQTRPVAQRPESNRPILLHPYPRFILPLSGEKTVRFADGVRVCRELLIPGEAIFGRPGAWIEEIWNSPHEMLSVIFSYQFVRILRIEHDGRSPEPDGPELWFHTVTPPGKVLEAALLALVAANADSEATRFCFRALLAWIDEHLQAESCRVLTAEDRLWSRAFDACQNLFRSDIALGDVAAAIGISPIRLSRLLHARTGLGFREYLNRLRLDYATRLLLTSEISVEEVARQCGYNYASYFIRIFEKQYGLSPTRYRIVSPTPSNFVKDPAL